jgi:hypothetical protein
LDRTRPHGTVFTGNSTPAQVTIRPNCITDPNALSGPQTVNQWFNPAAFAAPSAGAFGSCAKGVIKGPGISQLNAGTGKDFQSLKSIPLPAIADLVEYRVAALLESRHYRGIDLLRGVRNGGQDEEDPSVSHRYPAHNIRTGPRNPRRASKMRAPSAAPASAPRPGGVGFPYVRLF